MSTVPANGFVPDHEAPADLIPSSGELAVERIFYTSVYLDKVDGEDEALDGLDDLASSGGLDIGASVRPERMNVGYTRPATGVILTTGQSWYAKGVALGQLLHSVALAPGESTRIAVVDWSRRTRAGTTETISEEDALSQSSQQARSISEITSSVASEQQQGASMAGASAASMQATSFAGMVMPFVGGGNTLSQTLSFSTATNVSRTSGTRSLAADATQRIANSTQQYATASRTRRASIVREVFQGESEQITTRVITNYNHMHALSIQYYEVVQVYRVETRPARAERVLFIPMKPVDFADVRVVEHYRPVLARAARSEAARQLFNAPGDSTVRLEFALPLQLQTVGERRDEAQREMERAFNETMELKRQFETHRNHMEALRRELERLINARQPRDMAEASFKQAEVQLKELERQIEASNNRERAARERRDALAGEINQLTATLTQQARRAADSLGVEVGSGVEARAVQLPQNVRLERLSVSADGFAFQPGTARLTRHNGVRSTYGLNAATTSDLSNAPALDEIAQIDLPVPPGTTIPPAGGTLRVTLAVRAGSRRDELTYAFTVRPEQPVDEDGAGPQGAVLPLFKASLRAGRVELIQHLAENAAYYTQVIWSTIDPQTLTQLLANYKYQGRRIGSYLDPTPVAVTGNYIGFRWHFAPGEEEQERAFQQRWLDLGDTAPADELIPVPSGGVFAEAVLGRFNCAERIDLTRFWNWQDSPIPILPPEIAPLQAGSRAQAEELRPGQLSAPAVQIQAPQALPEFVGLRGVLQSIVVSNLFRDMSGQAATIAMAQKGLESVTSSATEGTKQANMSMREFARHQTALAKEAMPLIAAAATAGIGGAAGMPISAAGGALNAAGKLDNAGGARKSPASASVLGSLLGLGGALGKGGEGDKEGDEQADKKDGDEKADKKPESTSDEKAEKSEQAKSEGDA